MLPSDVMFAVFLISQICIGCLGNSGLFVFYTYAYFRHSPLKRPIDLIFIHLSLVNTFTMFKLIPEVMPSFGISHFLDDAGCQAILYMFRVIRGLPICTTALLSLFQAITISPSQSSWAWLKSRISRCISPALFSFWVINILIYSQIITSVRATHNVSMSGSGYYQLYCENKPIEHSHALAYLSSMVIGDGVFVVLMVWSSLYMVVLLYSHHKRVGRILSPNLSSPSSPEIRATQSIVLLASCFVIFYCLNNFMAFYMFYSPEKMTQLNQINGILSSGYPTLCPIVLMRNSKIPFHCPQSISKVKPAICHRAINSRQAWPTPPTADLCLQRPCEGEEMPCAHWILEMGSACAEVTFEWKIHASLKLCREKEDLHME